MSEVENLAPNGSSLPARVSPRPLLGDILIARGAITPAQLEAGLSEQKRLTARLGRLLVSSGAASTEDVATALALQHGTGRLRLAEDAPDPDMIARLGLPFCLKNQLVPWRRTGACTVIATVFPDSFTAHAEKLEALFGPVRFCLVSEEDLDQCLARIAPRQLAERAEHRTAEELSCRTWTGRGFRTGFAVVAVVGACALALAPEALVLALTLVALVLLVLSMLLKMAALFASSTRTRQLNAIKAAAANVVPLHAGLTDRLPLVSLLVPLYREDAVALKLVERLSRLTYPAALLDICLIVEGDDATTQATLQRQTLPATMRVISVPPSSLRTKPRALNFALEFCRGEVVGIYDAEDAPAPDQIDRVVAHFWKAPPDVACVQGRLGFYNADQNLLSRCFAMDYASWFSVVLPGIARLGLLVPLGGTTLFFRRTLLEELGGWDAHNVTEDADLGVRLHRAGYRTELLDTTTLEEANCQPIAWIRQRSRWIKGYAMTYATHMAAPGKLWSQIGPRAFAGLQIMFLGSLLQALLAPVLWLWWLVQLGYQAPPVPAAAVPVVIALLLASEAANVGLTLTALRRTKQLRLAPFVLLMNPYNMLATFAAYKALAEMAARPFYWDKTGHGLVKGTAAAAA